MSYDIDAATAAGHSVDDQLEYLAKLHNYDTNAATTSGHSKEDVLKYLAGLPEPSAKPATKTDTESSIPAAPAGAVIGAATGAMFGPAVGKVVDTGAHTAASVINPAAAPSKNMLMQALTGANESKSPQAVQNWYRTQSSNPFAGGKDYADADIKGKIAAGAPIKSPGNISKKGIRRGYLGINNQLPEETGPQKVASSILNADRTPTSSMLRRVAGGAETVGEFGHMVEEGTHGNYGSAALSGLGVLGGVASQSRNKPIRAIGTAIAAGVPAVQMVLPDDVNKKEGGLIHLAGGGQPEIGTAQAYEPSYNERIRDAIAPYIGMQQARGLMGSQGADSESKYNPISMLAQVPGSLGQNAKDFVHSSSEGDYLGAMGSYLSGATDAAPLLGGPGKLARLLNYQAGNKAFDKGIDAAEPYIEKGAKAVAPTIAKGIRFIDAVLPKHKSVLADTHLSPNLYNGKHVQIEGHAVGGKIIEAGADISKKLFTPRETKILRASEALAPHEGKWLNLTQSDRMRSTEGDLGGPGFSKFQLEKPEYAEAQAAWGVGKKPTASGIVNVNKRFPEGQALWAPMIGGETQHHSNQHVYDMLANEFNRQAGMGNLPAELQARINARIAQAPATKGMFPEHFDIGNPEHLSQYGDTFNRRGALSTVMSGEGVGGTKGRIIDYPGIMQEMTDPMTVGAPTHSIGTRLFSLSGDVEHRPDLHSAFPYILKGEDQGVAFAPVPKELGIQDFINQFKEFKGRDPGYYDLVRTTPSQQITDKYLKSLEEAGHKKGGKIKKKK